MQQHIITAATRGMKAGYNARKAVCKRSGLPQVRAAASESFADYCEQFGPQVTRYIDGMKSSPRKQRPVAVVETPMTEIEVLRARIAELEAEDNEPQVFEKAAPKSKSTKVKKNTWHPWAVRKHNIPKVVGAQFTYKGKRRTSVFAVTAVTKDGSVESIRVA